MDFSYNIFGSLHVEPQDYIGYLKFPAVCKKKKNLVLEKIYPKLINCTLKQSFDFGNVRKDTQYP